MKKALIVLVALLCLVGMTNAQSKFGATVQGAISLPMGDFGDICKTGFGGLGTVTYTLNKEVQILATIGYLTYNYKSSLLDGSSFSVVPILGGVRYLFGKDKFRPYVIGQLGVFSQSSKVNLFGTSTTVTSSDFGFNAGGGFLYQLGNKLFLDVTAVYSSISTSPTTTSLNVAAGVHFTF